MTFVCTTSELVGRFGNKNLCTMIRSAMRERRGVTEIGRKSESSFGWGTLGTGVITALFQSYGRLEAERVNQFCWNLVYSSKLGPQWQSRDQILKFLKFKMANGRHVGKYWKYHNSPISGLTEMKLGWLHPTTFTTFPPWCGCHGECRCLATAHSTLSSYEPLEAKRMNQFW